MSEVKFKLAAGTNVGLIRTNNEDNFVVCPDLSTSQWLIPQGGDYADLGPYGALLVVADGMGGANAGEVASAIAVKTIQELFVPGTLQDIVNDEKSIQRFMSDVVKAADLKILNRSSTDSSTQGMGTTVVMAWVLGTRAYICWCGDSRCYALSRRNNQLIQVSKDHSYVQELVDRGELAPEYMHDHPLSNVITRCLGDVDKRAQPETRVLELYDGDTILLCSDGLSGLVFDESIADILIRFDGHLMECKNELISAALNNGGHDNVTVAICTVKIDDGSNADPRPTLRHAATSEKEQLRATVVPVPINNHTVETQEGGGHQSSDSERQSLEASDPASESEPEPEQEDKKDSSEDQDTKDDTTEADSDAKQQEDASSEKSDNEPGRDNNTETENASEKDGQKSKKEKKKAKRVILLVLLLLIIATVCCIYLLPEGEPIRQSISVFINNQIQNLKK